MNWLMPLFRVIISLSFKQRNFSHTKRLSRLSDITSVNGKKMKAICVFSEGICYLKNHLINALNERNSRNDFSVQDILWILTVPAIWNDHAKQFMREAAEKAGIPRKLLIVGLEPECASVYCRTLPVEKFPQRVGTKYMVLDCGGGTVDVTVHEISENGKLKELYKASGGAWGGDKVNEKYCSFLEQIVGKQVLTKFKEESMSAWMNMLRDFEQIKRGLSKPQADDDEDEIFVRLEHDLIEEYEKHNGISLQEAFRLKKVKNPQGAMSRQKTVLEIPKTVVLEWIKSISKDIMNHVDDLLNNLNGNISFIIMVGGFSNSPILQDDVSSVRDIDVIVPEEAELSVVKGAVLFGWNPHIVTARRSKYSYGTRVCVSFNSDDHEEERKETTGTGKSYCEVLDKFMEEMQEVKVGDIVKRVYRPISSEQTSILVDIYYSQDKKVKYHNESGCNFLGNVRVPLPKSTNGKSRPSVCVCFTFGDTELHVDAEDTASGEKYADGSFNFISE